MRPRPGVRLPAQTLIFQFSQSARARHLRCLVVVEPYLVAGIFVTFMVSTGSDDSKEPPISRAAFHSMSHLEFLQTDPEKRLQKSGSGPKLAGGRLLFQQVNEFPHPGWMIGPSARRHHRSVDHCLGIDELRACRLDVWL